MFCLFADLVKYFVQKSLRYKNQIQIFLVKFRKKEENFWVICNSNMPQPFKHQNDYKELNERCGYIHFFPLRRTAKSAFNNHSANILFISKNYWTFSNSTKKASTPFISSLRFFSRILMLCRVMYLFNALRIFGINRIIIWKDRNNGVALMKYSSVDAFNGTTRERINFFSLAFLKSHLNF